MTEQCDQIGRFWKYLVANFGTEVAQNIYWLFESYCENINLATLGNVWATSFLVTLWPTYVLKTMQLKSKVASEK